MLGGALALLLGFAGFGNVQGLRSNGVITTAEVIDVAPVKSAATYPLRYALEDASVVTCSTEDVLGEPVRGDTIQVLYDREYPDVSCQSADYGTDFTEPIIFTAGGSVMIAASFGLYLLRRRMVA